MGVRVIAGRFGGRALDSLPGVATRPMLGRLRQTMFDILQKEISGRRFADLYAGTGAVGIEALSRGAASAVFVEASGRAAHVIRKNIATLGVADIAQVRTAPVRDSISQVEADIYFVGPPYKAAKEYAETLGVLGNRTVEWVIAQHHKQLALSDRYGALERVRIVKAGSNRLSLYRPSPPTSSTGELAREIRRAAQTTEETTSSI